jgi:uncharacterized protein (TIGR00369 family)
MTLLTTPPPDLTGLQHLQAMMDGELPPAPIALLMEFRPVELAEGRVVFAGTPDERHYNPIGTVHGGYAATLLDSAMGCAVQMLLPAGQGYTTLDLQVRYVRPMTVATGEVRAEGAVVHAGRRQAVAEGRVVRAADGKLLAHGTTTCLIL